MTGDVKKIDVAASAVSPLQAAEDGAKLDAKVTWKAVRAALISFVRGNNTAITTEPIVSHKEGTELLQDLTQSNLYMRFPHC